MTSVRLSGRQLQDAIVQLANLLDWIAYHPRNSRTADGRHLTAVAYQGKGWPDLVLVRERVVFAEIKGTGDSLRPEQVEWLATLDAAGAETHVWTPKAWRSGEVEAVLRHVEGVRS